MIISIRGTNGSGKTTVMRRLMEQATTQRPIFRRLGPRLPEGYELAFKGIARPVFIVGPYVTDAGGCDQIHPYDLVITILHDYAARGHVVFEGVLVASGYGRIGEWMEGFGKEAVMLFLTTSREQCIDNVTRRRVEQLARKMRQSEAKELNPKNLGFKYDMVRRIREKTLTADILRSVDASADEAPARVLALLKEARDVRG